jgi:glutamine amidotransferase
MCELFAMSARYPATVQLSLEEFSRHGGLAGPHKDGWGLGWYDEGDVQLIKEAHPAADSRCVRFIQGHPFASRFVLSHIRKATRGVVALRNCQPFMRELGGHLHLFAHNGDLPGIARRPAKAVRRFRPVGDTDSERAFCALLELLAPLWRSARVPPMTARLDVVQAFARRLRTLGPSNFIYCDGDALFAHADRRRQADGTIRAPGLWRLARHCPRGGELVTKGLRVHDTHHEQRVVLVASVPLTDEAWLPLGEGEVIVARAGKLAATAAPRPAPKVGADARNCAAGAVRSRR